MPTYPFQREHYWLDNPAPVPVDATRDDTEDVFWADVERGDLADLAESLELADEQSASLRAVLPVLAAWRKQSEWRYGVRWQPLKRPGTKELSGTWLVLTSTGAEAPGASEPTEWALQVLRERGARVVQLLIDPADPGPAAFLTKRISSALAGELPLSGILSLVAVDEDATAAADPAEALHRILPEALAEAEIDAPLWYVTRGAVSVGSADRLTRPGQAQLWGAAKLLAAGGGRTCGAVDLPEVLDTRAGGAFAAVLADDEGENQVAVRASGSFARRLTRSFGSGTRQADERVTTGTALVTGGDTPLGMEAARWLARNGAPRILLTTPVPDGLAKLAAELTALGAVVDTADCDPADREALAEVLAAIPAEAPLTAVVHAGAMHRWTADARPTSTETAEADAQLAAAVNLHELTLDEALESFVVFSSASGLLGTVGLGDDAPVHAFLDALVHHRRGLNLPGTSLIWGRLAGDGDTGGAPGHRSMRPRMAVRALGQALASGEATSVVADIDWEHFVPAFSGRGPISLIADVPEAEPFLASRSARPEPGPGVLLGQLKGLSPGAQEMLLLELIRKHAATVLGYSSTDPVDTTAEFLELGFSSLTALELRNRLCTATGLTLTPMAVYDHPTLERLAAYLRTELVGEPVSEAEQRTGA
ncbi:SDR family NAD(P)-dependent oxidoreductase [Streptomyces sp. NPDC058221]|uniref:SDR family NAD(P)-dependent oxidoreductase n=1 Tax=Streptomyces sp. NPDC058221 TaxID=3346388 RepID=UPI0036E5C40E